MFLLLVTRTLSSLKRLSRKCQQ